MATIHERLMAEQRAAQRSVARSLPDDEEELGPPRTLADISDEPPPPLLLGMLEPEGPNLLYGRGGVGKGVTVAHMIVELERLGLRTLIYDAENRPAEWARRIGGLGGDEVRASVNYLQPQELPLHLRGASLPDVVPHLIAQAYRAGANVLVVDSLLAGMNTSADNLKSDAGAPYAYVDALSGSGLTTISIGHPPRFSGGEQADPYGSVSWVNASRMTWLATSASEVSGPNRYAVRWKQRKANERGSLADVLLTFDFAEDGKPVKVTREDDAAKTKEWVLDVLDEAPAKLAELVERRVSEMQDDPGEQERRLIYARLRKTLFRLSRDGLVETTGRRSGRGGAETYRRIG